MAVEEGEIDAGEREELPRIMQMQGLFGEPTNDAQLEACSILRDAPAPFFDKLGSLSDEERRSLRFDSLFAKFSVALVHACEGRANGACDAETDDMDQDSAQALFSSAVDKNGQPITRRMMDRPVAP